MHTKKHLSFNGLRKTISKRFLQIEDYRQKGKVDHSLHDCFMSGFAMMFMQDPSLLEFQKRMQEIIHENNLQTVFNVSSIPKDTQIRDVLDNASNDEIENIFSDFFRLLQRGKQLERFQFLDGYYLIPLDGSGYFSSEKISCPGCLIKTPQKGNVRYEHQILQAVMVCPGEKQVIPLAPEPIRNTDGTIKQDCEINAAKRILKKVRKAHPQLKIIISGDDLYSKQPFINELKKKKMSFILVAKPTDHKILYEWIEGLKKIDKVFSLKYTDLKGREHLYEWINDIPLNGTKDADNVNYFEYHLIVEGKVTYHNSWVTDIVVDKNNVKELVKGGRARWKIENENFNTLKNQGYHIEHNFGHGKKNLSFTFFLLNLIAFFMHQIFELTDPIYQTCRKKFSARKEYWNQLRCTFRILLFQDWENLLKFVICPPDSQPP